MKRRQSDGLSPVLLSAPFLDSSPRRTWRSRYCVLPRMRRRLVWLVLLTLTTVTLFVALFTTDNAPATFLVHSFDDWAGRAPPRMRQPVAKKPLGPPVPCLGPRGQLLGNSSDDDLRPSSIDIPYPTPFVGSHDVLGIAKTWMTPQGRYGAYGLGEGDESYDRSPVDWATVDWGHLQNECLRANEDRFPAEARPFLNNTPRFTLKHESKIPSPRRWDDFADSRRTAIVIRAFDGYVYKPEDMYHIRSLIVEASLKTGGEFSVVLLVHIRDTNKFHIWDSHEEYERALKAAGVPEEFHSIAVLWSNPLLESWYPKTLEHDTFFQVFQPMQLFALHYPEFDHFWQFEMDMRFTGDVGAYLKAVDDFSRNEPRKQMHERSTFLYDPVEFADYDDFRAAVDAANRGNSHYWGPAKVREVYPIGPKPPTSVWEDDFEWGVGEDADAVVTSVCDDARKSRTWVFSSWVFGFAGIGGPPRFFCPPAIQRGSRSLLVSIHNLQLRGLRIASEATLPSFALWLGLKISYPPLPWYQTYEPTKQDRDGWFLGGPQASQDGWGRADPQWGVHSVHNEPKGESTFWWSAGWSGEAPRSVFKAWLDGKVPRDNDKLSRPLATRDGQMYIPNMMMHPVKSN